MLKTYIYKTSSKRVSKSNVYKIGKNIVKKAAIETRSDIKKLGKEHLVIHFYGKIVQDKKVDKRQSFSKYL